MRVITAILFILMFFLKTAYSETLYVTINPLTCIACTAGLYELAREVNINKIHVVMQSTYKTDSTDVNNIYRFDKFSKLEVTYSDLLYDKLSEGNDAEVIVLKGKEEVYRGLLKRLELSAIKKYFPQGSISIIDSVHSNSIDKNLNTIYITPEFLVIDNILNKWALINKKTKQTIFLTLHDGIIESLYKELYKSKFDVRYPVIKQMINETPTFAAQISHIQEWDSNTIAINVNLKDYNIKGRDTIISINNMIIKYDIIKKAVVDCYLLKGDAESLFFLWDLYIIDDYYYASGISGIKEIFCLVSLMPDKENRIFHYQKDILNGKPNRYKEITVSSMEDNNVVLRKNLFAFAFDNEITNIASGDKVSIPFQYTSNRYNEYEIRDVEEDADNYYVLYLKEQDVTGILRFSKKGNDVKNIEIGGSNEIKKYAVRFYDSGHKIIYKPAKSDALVVAEINY